MSDTAIQPVNGGDASDQKIQTLTSLVQMLAEGQKKLENGMVSFSNSVIQALTGQAQGQTIAAPVAGAKRRGRPPKALSEAPTVKAKPAPQALTPMALKAIDFIDGKGYATQTELANLFKIERSLVQHHMSGPLEHGKVTCVYYKRPGEHRHIVYYRPDWVHIKKHTI